MFESWEDMAAHSISGKTPVRKSCESIIAPSPWPTAPHQNAQLFIIDVLISGSGLFFLESVFLFTSGVALNCHP